MWVSREAVAASETGHGTSARRTDLPSALPGLERTRPREASIRLVRLGSARRKVGCCSYSTVV